MLNEIGGGGKKGASLLMMGGSFNSLLASLAPILVGAYIADISNAKFSDVNPVLFIAMGIFALVGIVLYVVNIPEPAIERISREKSQYSAWSFRHFVLGAIGIFIYVGVEVGIPGTMKFFLEDAKGFNADIAGTIAGTYWFLMLIGRLAGVGIAAKISAKKLLSVFASIAMILIVTAMLVPANSVVSMPVFSDWTFKMENAVPLSCLFFVLVGLCTSVMWGGIYNLAVEGIGKYVKQASGIFMMMVVGGGILPLLQNGIVDWTGDNFMISYLLPLAGLAYLLFYALIGSKNVNKDIPVE
jgi:FHS family L-fucose permease-like MFS transporter